MNFTGQITEHFSLDEFGNSSARELIKGVISPKVIEHAQMLEELRVWYGKPFVVTSWYRTASFNHYCGGIDSSQHLKGLATDVKLKGLSTAQYETLRNRWQLICKNHKCVGECGYYDWGIHFGSFITYSNHFYVFDKRSKK